MYLWKEQDSPAYPYGGECEDTRHIWLCQGGDADSLWNTSLANLATWLECINTDAEIEQTIN